MEKNVEELENIIARQNRLIEELSRDFSFLFEHSKVGIVHVDKDGKFLKVNNKFCRIVGYPKDEVLNLTFSDITCKADIDKDLKIHNQTKKDKTRSFTLEKRYVKKDGSLVWVEIFINHIEDEDGNFLYTLGLVTDITKRKKIHNTIIEQTKTMQLYLDIVDVMIVALNKEGNITLVNRKTCEILGYEEHQIIGKNWFNNFIYEEDKNAAVESFLKFINKEQFSSEKSTYSIVCKDDTHRIILWRRAFIYDDEKNITGIIASGEDITEVLKLEAENKKSEEALFNQSKLASMGEMIRNIAHQWRQPLSTISTAASGMKLQKEIGVLDDKEFDISMTAIVNTTQYLSQTIDDFQNFFKMDNTIQEFTTSDLLDRVSSLILTSYKINQINLVLKSDVSSVVKGPLNEIIQIILNILNNARDALIDSASENRVVYIYEYFENDTLHITIKDNAGGIPKSILDRIFEPYFTTKHQSLGTGIGLYMVKDIVENRLNGSIEAFNDIVEYNGVKREGAVFKLHIPNTED